MSADEDKGYPEEWEFVYRHLLLAKQVFEKLENGAVGLIELDPYEYLRMVKAIEEGFAAKHKRAMQ